MRTITNPPGPVTAVTAAAPASAEARVGSGEPTAVASYPREQWWVAAYGEEVSRAPWSRRILGRSVLLYRRGDGTPVALDNRCAHRSYPLSRGTVEGDNIACGYHGYTYAATGICVKVPAQGRVPARARVHSYPVVERGPFVWIWTGDPARADEALIPPVPGLSGDGWTHARGYYHIRANWLDLHENLQPQDHPCDHPQG